jgi:hypothetical protein
LEGACELEREEGIAAGRPVQLAKRGPREPRAESPQNRLHCVEAERLDLNALDASRRQCSVEQERRVVALDPSRRDKAHLLGIEPAQDEADDSIGRRIDPLQVVDGNQERPDRRQPPKDAERGLRDCTWVGMVLRCFTTQECDLECAPLRSRQLVQRIVGDVIEEIDQSGEPEAGLSFRRARYEDPEPVLACLVETAGPDARLADSRLAFDQQRARPVRDGLEERERRFELGVTPDNLAACLRGHAS